MIHNTRRRLEAVFNPERYHGWGRSSRYFEGWYFKMVSESEEAAYAIIPGIAMDEQGKQQAFIQVLNGRNNETAYHEFPAESFQPHPEKFELQLGENFFSQEKISVALPEFEGELVFRRPVLWPKRTLAPGIMGWYTFVPFMECYHGVLCMDAEIEGVLRTPTGSEIDFNGGRLYLEKDWGRSFPSSWIWMQSNHFDQDSKDISFKASVARIPWLTGAFVGFIVAFWDGARLHKYATYTGAKLKEVKVNEGVVDIVISDRRSTLSINVQRAEGGLLVSPVMGLMEGRVSESMDAVVNVQIRNRAGEITFEGTGRNTGFEVGGKFQELLL